MDPDPAAFLKVDRNPALKLFKNDLMMSFLKLKRNKILLKSKKKTMDLNILIKLQSLLPRYRYNFLCIFLLFSICSFLDPDLGGKMDADPDPQP